MAKKTTKKTAPRKSNKKAPKALVVEIKEVYFSSGVREKAREMFGNAFGTDTLKDALLMAMTAKRDLRRMSESEGGTRAGKLFKTALDAQAAIEQAKKEGGFGSLFEMKQLARATCYNGSRIFDIRHPAEKATA